jgi:hypothetical protein
MKKRKKREKTERRFFTTEAQKQGRRGNETI